MPPAIAEAVTRLTGEPLLASARAHFAKFVTAARSAANDPTRRDAALAFAVRVASAALLYLTQIALARWMGGYEYGLYVFVWTWVLVLGGLAPVGLSMVMVRLIPEYAERGDHGTRRGLVFGGRLFVIASAILITALGLAGLWTFSGHIESPYILPAYLALVCVPLYALCDVQDGVGRGHGWMGLAIMPAFILRPVLLLAAMAAAHFAGLSMTAATAAGGAIVATGLATLAQTLLMNRRLADIAEGVDRRYDFPRWLGAGMPLLVMGGADLLLQNTDVLVISAYLPPEDVGIYFAAAKTMALVMFVHYAVGSAAAREFAALNARGDRAELERYVRASVGLTFWPSLAAAAAILVMGWPLLSLFGTEFSTGYPLMFVLVVGYLFRSAMGPAEYLLTMLGEQSRCAVVMVATVAVNFALNLMLVPTLGLLGAALSTAISISGSALAYAWIAERRLGIPLPIWRNLPGRSPD